MSQKHSSDEETDFKAVNATNYQRIQEKVEKINYVDGIADGREQIFQSSFDQGYADGLRTGIELAKFQAFYNKLPTSAVDSLEQERAAYMELKLAKATDKSHFKYLEHQCKALSIVSEKQTAYIDDFLNRCATNQPNTTNLFKSQAK